MTTLYVMRDAKDQILYVGISDQPMARFTQHKADKPWFARVASIQVTHYDTRQAASAAERVLISTLRPPHNKALNPCDRPMSQIDPYHVFPEPTTNFWPLRFIPLMRFMGCPCVTPDEFEDDEQMFHCLTYLGMCRGVFYNSRANYYLSWWDDPVDASGSPGPEAEAVREAPSGGVAA